MDALYCSCEEHVMQIVASRLQYVEIDEAAARVFDIMCS